MTALMALLILLGCDGGEPSARPGVAAEPFQASHEWEAGPMKVPGAWPEVPE